MAGPIGRKLGNWIYLDPECVLVKSRVKVNNNSRTLSTLG